MKDLVDMKVRNLIDGFPLTQEGYDKAKNILVKRYGNTSEVVSANVRNILEPLVVRERDVKKIHEFYKTLLFNVESIRNYKVLTNSKQRCNFHMTSLKW